MEEGLVNTPEIKAAILSLLQRNARMPVQEIADRLDASPDTVSALLTGMEQDGTIMGYHALVNEEKAGGGVVRALIEVEVQPERDGGFDRVALRISKFPEVRAVHLVSGTYDLGVEVVGESLQDVALFVASKLAAMAGVRSTVTHFLLRKYKESGFQLQDKESHERLKVVP